MTNLLLGLVLVLCAIVPAFAEDPDLAAAKNALQTARASLKAAKGDFGGHRTKAVELVNSAIDQIDDGLKVDTRVEHKDDKKAGAIEKKINKLEKRKDKLEEE